MSNLKQLTVGEIMEVFKTLPPEMLVLYTESEYSDFTSIQQIEVRDVIKNTHCLLSYEAVSQHHPEKIKAVILI